MAGFASVVRGDGHCRPWDRWA